MVYRRFSGPCLHHSLYQSAEQRWRDLGSNSHGNTECKAHTCHLNTSSSPVACLLCPQLKELSLKGHLHGIPALKIESSDTSHDTKQPHLSQPARPVRWKIKRGDFFRGRRMAAGSFAHIPVFFSKQCSLTPFQWYLIPGPEVERFPVFDLMTPFRTAILSCINKSG